jgi:hypothetical protein
MQGALLFWRNSPGAGREGISVSSFAGFRIADSRFSAKNYHFRAVAALQ